MAGHIPDYIRSSVPIPAEKRAPWYKNTFPSYAGIYLWVAFYLSLAGPTISKAGLGVCLLGLAVAGLIGFALFYYSSGMLGMQTGRPLYIVGTSTFGATGGYLMPGLLMGLLQIGWFAVAVSIATDFIMQGLHQNSRTLYTIIALVWAYGLAWVAVKGISYVARVAEILNWVPIIMIVVVLWANRGGIVAYHPATNDSWGGFLEVLTIVIGFSATAGAAGADFAMNNRNGRDVALGGLTGIALTAFLAGGLPLLSVAGHIGLNPGVAPDYSYTAAIAGAGALAPIMFFLFAAASGVPTCFATYIAANSFGTIFPKIPRQLSTFVAVTVGVVLAITGVAENLVGFFQIVGASFGPICGAMAADYLLSGRKWSGPRRGVNWAGYAAWALGFAVGILGDIPGVPAVLIKADQPAVLISFVVGFAVYFVLAKLAVWSDLIPSEELTRS
ncbi:MAG TPA: cytosine permease [Terriglobia bacterium]|nr:cytosine permease [Terriglobia bacterium]